MLNNQNNCFFYFIVFNRICYLFCGNLHLCYTTSIFKYFIYGLVNIICLFIFQININLIILCYLCTPSCFVEKNRIDAKPKRKIALFGYDNTTLENLEHYLDLINKTSPLSEASAIIFSSICDRSNPIPDTKKKIEIFKFLNQIKQKYDIDNLFYGFPLGHCTYKLTIPIGINATLFSKNGSIRLTQSPFMEQTNSLSSTYFSHGR